MLKIIKIIFLLQLLSSSLWSQYYTHAQIISIDASKLGAEGDLYLDTLNSQYYIGLSNGEVTQINLDSNFVKGILSGYFNDSLKGTIFPIWAEESAALTTNAFEWAYGNGDDSQADFGIVMPVECELFAVGLTLLNGTGEVEVYKNGIATGATTGVGAIGATLNTLLTPISFLAGDNLNFRTLTTAGASSGGKVVAWLKILSKIPSYERFNGSGIPSLAIGNNGDEYIDISTGNLYIKEGGAWNFKLNIKGPSGAISNKSIIQVTNTVSANVNTIAGVTFNWIDIVSANVLTNNAADFIVATNGITIVKTGLYKVTAFQYQVGTSGARNNASLRFTINGSVQPGIGANTYQRMATGHNETTASLVKVLNIASGEKIGLRNIAIAATGNVTCPTGTLVFIIEQL